MLICSIGTPAGNKITANTVNRRCKIRYEIKLVFVLDLFFLKL